MVSPPVSCPNSYKKQAKKQGPDWVCETACSSTG
jgi:hypothetical protein